MPTRLIGETTGQFDRRMTCLRSASGWSATRKLPTDRPRVRAVEWGSLQNTELKRSFAWLPFVRTFRTLCSAPTAEVKWAFEEIMELDLCS